MSKLTNQLKQLPSQWPPIEALKKLKRSLLTNVAAWQQHTQKLALMAQKMSAQNAAWMQQAWTLARQNAAKLKQAHWLQALGQVRASLQATGIHTKNLGQSQAQLAQTIQATTRALAQQQQQYQALQKMSAGTTRLRQSSEQLKQAGADVASLLRVAGLALQVPLQAWLKTEPWIRKLEMTMTQAGGKRSVYFGDMVKNAEALSRILPVTNAQMLHISNLMLQQGFSEKTVLGGGAKSAAQLGVLMHGDFEGAVDVLSMGSAVLQLPADEIATLADYMQKLAHFGMNSGQMTELFKSYAPHVKMSGFNGQALIKHVTQLGAMAASMKMDTAAFGNALVDLSNATLDPSKLGKANKLLAKHKIKLNFMDDQGNYQGDDHFMQEILKLHGLSDQTLAAVKKALFGHDKQKNELLSGILRLAKSWQDISQALDHQGSMQQRLAVSMQSLPNQWGRLTATLDNAMFKIGASFEDEMQGVLDMATKLAAKLAPWMEQNPKLVKGLVMVVAGLAAMAAAVMGLALFLGAVLAPFAALKFVLGTMAIQLLGFGAVASKVASVMAGAFHVVRVAMLAALANPALLAGLAIVAALAAAAYLIYNHWGTIQDFFAGLWDGIQQGVSSLLSFLTNLVGHFAGVGWEMMRGLAHGMLNGLGLTQEVTTAAAGSIEDSARAKLKTQTPAQVLAAMGVDTMTGLAQGMAPNSGRAWVNIGSSLNPLTAANMPSATPTLGTSRLLDEPISGGQNFKQPQQITPNITIHVHPSEGMDEHKLAEKIKQILQKQTMAKNNALFDLQ